MPVTPCRKNGTPGLKACPSSSCPCYTGPDALQKAQEQEKAIRRATAERQGKRLL